MVEEPHNTQMQRLLTIMARLRDPDGGCPWDLEQTFATIAPYTIEEACEVSEAIDQDDMAALRDELGDLLLQVVFHARIAKEAQTFAFEDVVQAIADKMVRRHPHVFGEAAARDAVAVKQSWEEIKATERNTINGGLKQSSLDGVAQALPALLRASKLQKRAASVGFDWPNAAAVLDKVDEELDEVKTEVLALEQDPDRLAHAEEEIGSS